MAHLSGFGLENFRVFKDYTWFDFAPITILVGPNNSGKSSLIKALLLLKDNYERNLLSTDYDKSILRFDGGFHSLSSGQNVLNNTLTNNLFKFTFDYNVKSFKSVLKFEFMFDTDNDITRRFSYISLKTVKNEILFRLTRHDVYLNPSGLIECLVPEQELIDEINEFENLTEDYNSDFDPSDYIHQDYLNSVRKRLINIRLVKDFFNEKNRKNISFNFSDFYNLNKNLLLVTGIEDGDVNESKMPYETFLKAAVENYSYLIHIAIFGFSSKPFKKYTDEERKDGFLAIDALLELMDLQKDGERVDAVKKFSQLSNIFYLSPIKGQLKRAYQSNEDHILNSLIKKYRESPISSMDEYFMKWQKAFEIKEIAIERDDRLDANYVTIGDRSLTDSGYGLSQLTTLLVMIGLQRKENNILLLEEPESNMHPKYQSLLADVFVEAKHRNQFIIETHSEYLIRKLQYLTAKGEVKPEDVVIYYFHDPNNVPAGEKQVKKINILEDGSLSDDFGPGFYDEAAHWELELLKLKRSKTRQN